MDEDDWEDDMNNFKCSFYYINLQGEKMDRVDTACWSATRYPIDSKDTIDNKIYISDYDKNPHIFTEERLNRIVKLINAITPCKLVTIEEREYIEFTLLSTYDQSLCLLNFIRYLWWEQDGFDCITFFDYIIKNKKREDTLVKLTMANKEACGTNLDRDHSNALSNYKLIPKTKKQLYEFNGQSLTNFLTSNYE